ncbi:NlpC/P60 family protein [Pantoea sp. App145]|uniref:NlpC/P60 family protein n=1 Tax=Pantoea sp. App145 TaxID=3071567 RepID=UPI003A809743
MIQREFIGLVNGKPWANRACCFEQMDCWGLVVLYYRHVLDIELHHMAGYEAQDDFITCYEQEISGWSQAASPDAGTVAVFYRGAIPAHIGVMVSPVKCLHARGEFGFVRLDSPLALLKVYEKVEYLVHGPL